MKKKKKKGLFGIHIGSAGDFQNIMKNMKFSAAFENEMTQSANERDGIDMSGAENLYTDDDSSMRSSSRTNSTNTEMRSDMASFLKKHIDKQITEDPDEDEGGQGHVLKMASDLPSPSMMEPQTPLMGGTFAGFDDPKTPKQTYQRQVFASQDSRDHSTQQSPLEVKKMGIDYSLFESNKKKKIVDVDEDELKKLKSKGKKGGLLGFFKRKKKKNSKRGSVSPKTPTNQPFNMKRGYHDFLKQLKPYGRKLETIQKQAEALHMDFVKKLEQYRENMITVLESLHKRYLTSVSEAFRNYMTCKILLTRHRIQMEELSLVHIQRRIEFVKRVSKTYSTKFPSYICENFFKDIHHVSLQSPKGSILWNKIKRLEMLEKDLFQKYDRMRRSFSKAKIGKEGEIFLRRFVLEKYEFPYNNKVEFEIIWQDEAEEKFFSIVGDKRTQTGMSISSFLEELSDIGMARVRPKEYVRYINSVVKCMKNIYNIDSKEDIKKMRAMVHRFIFNLIGDDLIKIEEEKNLELDIGYNENCVLLRHFSPIQLGVPRQFLNPDGMSLSFQKAILMLQNIQYCTDPNAMLHAIKLSCSSIGEEARRMCIQNGEAWCFGADDFFPILTYVIVQCQVNDIHSHLKYISKYATLYTHEEGNSEVRYFLTCLDGAAEYISGISVEKLRELLQEKNEKLKLKNFCPYEKNEEEFQKMEDCLFECIDICEGMIEECQVNTLRDSDSDDEELRIRYKYDNVEDIVGESDISKHLEIDDMDIDSFLLEDRYKRGGGSSSNGDSSLMSSPSLTPVNSAGNINSMDQNEEETEGEEKKDEINQLLQDHMSKEQIDVISSILE